MKREFIIDIKGYRAGGVKNWPDEEWERCARIIGLPLDQFTKPLFDPPAITQITDAELTKTVSATMERKRGRVARAKKQVDTWAERNKPVEEELIKAESAIQHEIDTIKNEPID